MVNWYNVQQLASTGLKTLISGIFGNFADKREMEAALSPGAGAYHALDKDELWIDYVSDLGDGFNPTYTVAYSLAQPVLSVGGKALQQGDVLIMGGDAVYPTPEAVEYENRLQGPYNAAFPWKDKPAGGKPYTKKLFVLPGNHDWYDGLGNFIKLFCQKRALGRWLTEQERSYFAVRLPHKYWLIGIDVQLNADIDKPQMDYFRKILEGQDFEAGSSVILCTAEPSWVYNSWDQKNKSHARIQFFIDRILYGDENCSYYEKNKSLRVAAILTGDLHHYSRYEQVHEQTGRVTQLVTAGGGGAFAHPTHLLKESITLEGGYEATRRQAFPTAAQSRRLAWWNLLFPFFSLQMWLFFGAFHLFTTWFLQSGRPDQKTFLDQVKHTPDLSRLCTLIYEHIRHSPSVVFLNLVLLAGLTFFADTATGRKKWNYIAGGIHGLLQLLVFYLLVWAFAVINMNLLQWPVRSFRQIALFSAEMLVIGGWVCTMIFGIYLLVSTLVIRNHPTEAFSSFRWQGYKNFLRIKITRSAATIYAIGIRKIVTDWEEQSTDPHASRFRPKQTIDYTLIDEIELKP
ncbi:metallophosphoesterase [Fulvivirgaceae bacterium PWU37]|uniref:Metallophosphoesterase n=2 Tax=Dawidia soli TaxID=2782352 RepID=A0AAP2GH34_9BACT|nr:metallophosphoesterase [Dawidia soli]